MHHHSSDQDRERQKMEWKEMEGFFFLCVVCWWSQIWKEHSGFKFSFSEDLIPSRHQEHYRNRICEIKSLIFEIFSQLPWPPPHALGWVEEQAWALQCLSQSRSFSWNKIHIQWQDQGQVPVLVNFKKGMGNLASGLSLKSHGPPPHLT